MIFAKFKLDITKYPTLPTLAFGLYRTKYLKKNKIAMLSGKIAKDIRGGYTGGSTDMFIPKLDDNKQIYAYDVNSLYPFVMKSFVYPVGYPT